MKFKIMIFLALAFTSAASAQNKQPLTPEVFKKWNYITGEKISPNGQYAAYEQLNRDSLRLLFIHNKSTIDTITYAWRASFSPDSKYLLYSIENKKLDKKKSSLSQSTFYVRNLTTNEEVKFTSATSLSFLYESGSLIQITRRPADTSSIMKSCTDIILFDPIRNDSTVFRNVLNYRISNKNELLLVNQKKDTTENILSLFDIQKKDLRPISESKNINFSMASFSSKLDKMAYLKRRMVDKKPIYSLYIYSVKNLKLIDSVSNAMPDIPNNFTISGTMKLGFSRDASQVYFKVAENPVDSVKNNIKKADKAISLDIWKWNATSIPPAKKEESNLAVSHFCSYDLDKKRLILLSGDEMPFLQFPDGEFQDITIGFSNEKYEKYEGIEPSVPFDSYIVHMKTGERRLVLEREYYTPSISYDKQYIAWFNCADRSWYSMNTKTLEKRNMTASIDDVFYNDELDTPMHDTHLGFVGWTDNGHSTLVNSKYDLWKIDAAGVEAPVCLTKGEGKKNGIRFRYIKLVESDRYFNLAQNFHFEAFQVKTKKAGYYLLDAKGDFRPLIFTDNMYQKIVFSIDGSACIWRKESFTEFPELYHSDAQFKNIQKLSETNPQQKNYIWGTSELVAWESFNKDNLQGILCKPENFDPAKKYPMIVYFYEKKSDNLHKYNTPMPIGTVINWSYCVSNGYLVFIPDVVFRTGDPAASSYDAIVSGVKSLIDKYDFIDKDNIGINGHSWGGYQTAYLVTRTNMFKAATSGAPVVNMISGYGGIRWESGKSRMFQYEHTQSRMGATLWEQPDAYIRNSSIFSIPNIQTPVLIMHNDQDGSVMWEQGIEFFMAMRRLEKPAWLLNYKGEDHALAKWDNRMDYTNKVMGFFDHYLKGAPQPDWMRIR